MQSLPATTQSSVSLDACAHALLDSVTPVNRFIRRQMCECQKDLSLPQFRTLVCVSHPADVSLSNVAHFLGSSMPTASRIVSGLVQKGMILRKGCSDRRQVSLELTDRGREVMERAWSGAQSALEAKLQHLSDHQRTVVTNAMGVLQSVFGSAGLKRPSV